MGNNSVTLNPDYILLCETFLTDQTASLYQIPGYKLVHKSRTAKTRGGVAIYIRDNIPFHVREDLGYFIEGEFESIFIETTQSGLKHSIIGEIYRVPNTNEKLSVERFERIFERLKDEKKDIIVGCDQNFDLIKVNEHPQTNELLTKAFSNGLIPLITKPTRITHNTATLIDNVYVNAPQCHQVMSGILLSDISDHLPVFAFLGKKEANTHCEPLVFKYRNLNEEAITHIKEYLGNSDWDYLNGMEVDNAFETFVNAVNRSIDTFAPEKNCTY